MSHVLTVHFDDGDTEYLSLDCQLTGTQRPCAVIACPVDHEDTSRACIETHGAQALDKCWAVEYFDAGGREALDTQALKPAPILVDVHWDDGVVVENA